MSKLTVDHYAVLRKPLESGRQSPKKLAEALFLSVPIVWLLYVLTYTVGSDSTNYPNVEKLQTIQFSVTVVISILSIVFAVPFIYKKIGWLQYALTVIVSQFIFTLCQFTLAFFFMGQQGNASGEILIKLTYYAIILGVLILLVTSIRFAILLRKGAYKKGSSKDVTRSKFETKSYVPIAVIASTGFFLLLQYTIRTIQFASLEEAILTYLPLLIAYVTIFVLPEQLVIVFCKIRFKEFNYDSRGYLYSLESTEKNIKNG
ncbi:ABC transporter ATPase [Rossellomorea marisflavi]|uniref:ABC transporter ATPase n=1 Tax=Rossellomorea marisflavi TaxID=189381 RepID=UPI00207A3939|nr:ABC transporter ATPase [Rossellomorea marisflavi]USK93466.1 ABC transporter ATPase [Rossellomorea marisflavi]